MSAATKDAPKKASDFPALQSLLGTDTKPLAELRGAVDDLTLAKAWAAGHIELGHRKYCVTGPVGKMGSALVLEEGWDWPDPRLSFLKKNFAEVVAEEPPKTEKCKKYQLFPPPPDRPMEEPQLRPVEIRPEEAHAAIAFHVRLTPQGLAAA